MRLDGLWRYPVKSLGGEALGTAELTDDGIPGDRVVHVRNDRGPLTGRTRHGPVSDRPAVRPNQTAHQAHTSWRTSCVVSRCRSASPPPR